MKKKYSENKNKAQLKRSNKKLILKTGGRLEGDICSSSKIRGRGVRDEGVRDEKVGVRGQGSGSVG